MYLERERLNKGKKEKFRKNGSLKKKMWEEEEWNSFSLQVSNHNHTYWRYILILNPIILLNTCSLIRSKFLILNAQNKRGLPNKLKRSKTNSYPLSYLTEYNWNERFIIVWLTWHESQIKNNTVSSCAIPSRIGTGWQ